MERVLKIQLLTSSPSEPQMENNQENLKDFVISEVQKAFEKYTARKKLAIS